MMLTGDGVNSLVLQMQRTLARVSDDFTLTSLLLSILKHEDCINMMGTKFVKRLRWGAGVRTGRGGGRRLGLIPDASCVYERIACLCVLLSPWDLSVSPTTSVVLLVAGCPTSLDPHGTISVHISNIAGCAQG